MRMFEGTPWDRPPTCERCGKPESECACPPEPQPKQLVPPEKQTARLTVEKRKKGKLVTVIRGLSAEATDLPALLVRLKNSCGAGGTLDGDSLEIQGDHLDRLRTLLSGIGYNIDRKKIVFSDDSRKLASVATQSDVIKIWSLEDVVDLK